MIVACSQPLTTTTAVLRLVEDIGEALGRLERVGMGGPGHFGREDWDGHIESLWFGQIGGLRW